VDPPNPQGIESGCKSGGKASHAVTETDEKQKEGMRKGLGGEGWLVIQKEEPALVRKGIKKQSEIKKEKEGGEWCDYERRRNDPQINRNSGASSHKSRRGAGED